MIALPRPQRAPSAARQRGQAILFALLLLAVGIGLFAYGAAISVSLDQQRDAGTWLAMSMAREALIGRSASDANRPGSVPCPDTNDDGVAEIYAGADCPSYIGRLPWRTLGLPDLRDSSGERLWYAVLQEFARNPSCGSACPLNNDTKGAITVYQDSAATALTTEAVAVIFAPGISLDTQNRSSTATALCPTTGTTIALNLCAANYLETAAGVNNATTTGPFISAQASGSFNDRLLVVTTAHLMPVIEQRVAREIVALLQAYRAVSACACYPWAASNFDDDSVAGTTRGGVPIENALPENWGAGGIPAVPSWLPTNKWGDVFYYAVAPLETASHSPATTLTVDGAPKNMALITTGPAGASRPSLNLPDYLDDAENSNNDDIFQTPSSTAYARDRLYTVP